MSNQSGLICTVDHVEHLGEGPIGVTSDGTGLGSLRDFSDPAVFYVNDLY